jgi:hypothetical protein
VLQDNVLCVTQVTLGGCPPDEQAHMWTTRIDTFAQNTIDVDGTDYVKVNAFENSGAPSPNYTCLGGFPNRDMHQILCLTALPSQAFCLRWSDGCHALFLPVVYAWVCKAGHNSMHYCVVGKKMQSGITWLGIATGTIMVALYMKSGCSLLHACAQYMYFF